MNKKYIFMIITIVILATLSILSYNYYQSPYMKCMREMSSDLKVHKSQYLKGDIIVNFKEGTSKEEQTQTINSYGYQIVYWYSKNSALVKVPSGHEMESICRLRGSSLISSSGINVIFDLSSFNRQA